MWVSFELVLVPAGDSTIDRGLLWRDLDESPHIRPERGVPGKLSYYHPATTVHFSLALGDEFHSEAEEKDLLARGVPDHVDVLSDSSLRSPTSRRDEEEPDSDEYDESDESEEEDEEDDRHIDLPPVSIHIPLFRPTFFLLEALGFLEGIRERSNLRLAIPSEGTNEAADGIEHAVSVSPSREEVLGRWQTMHRQIFPEVPDKERLQVWSRERCAAFYDYNRGLEDIAREFARDGFEVVPIQPARHEDVTKTLCVWRTDRPAVLPRTDLVLVRRPRARGLFRRGKIEEFLVPGDNVWRILERFSESRYEPAPMLIVRSAEEAPGQLRADIEALQGESTESARRTELAGVVDFELATD